MSMKKKRISDLKEHCEDVCESLFQGFEVEGDDFLYIKSLEMNAGYITSAQRQIESARSEDILPR